MSKPQEPAEATVLNTFLGSDGSVTDSRCGGAEKRDPQNASGGKISTASAKRELSVY
ncbi:hypothetical protein [Teichococcus coralli]|uniref:hypothetical protein n=1 Tax=Teichococcus coralli TaxID=2545983 RepID=UPI00136DAA54|nr:hypothetical protein [Pseudoroseomonas coralli]